MAATFQASYHHTTASKTVFPKEESSKNDFFLSYFSLSRKEISFPEDSNSLILGSLAKTWSPQSIKKRRRIGISLPQPHFKHLRRIHLAWLAQGEGSDHQSLQLLSWHDQISSAQPPRLGFDVAPTIPIRSSGPQAWPDRNTKTMAPATVLYLYTVWWYKEFSHYGPWAEKVWKHLPPLPSSPKTMSCGDMHWKGPRPPMGNEWWERHRSSRLEVSPHAQKFT